MIQQARAMEEDFTSEAECFLDAFQNGELHVDTLDLIELTVLFSKQELASLYLPVCRDIIWWGSIYEESPDLKILMDCYSALVKWQCNDLPNVEELTSALEGVRILIFRKVLEKHSSWLIEVLCKFELLELGIQKRIGAKDLKLSNDYKSIRYKLNP